jgi:hypothetical protein
LQGIDNPSKVHPKIEEAGADAPLFELDAAALAVHERVTKHMPAKHGTTNR